MKNTRKAGMMPMAKNTRHPACSENKALITGSNATETA